MTAKVERLLRISLNVSDLARSVAFYRDALGFAVVERTNASAKLALGEQQIELSQPDPPGADYPADSTAADLWFQHFAIVTNDMDAAFRRLAPFHPAPITDGSPVLLPPAAGGVTAYKFRDPDGHPLELIQFPAGTGDPRWQQGIGGIDHSAISVADAGRSIAFYQNLGFHIMSRQINSGPAQDRLDGLQAVEVEVVGLAPAGGPTPHLELLCYRTPAGRAASVVGSGDIAATALNWLAAGDALRLTDPDGHIMNLFEMIPGRR